MLDGKGIAEFLQSQSHAVIVVADKRIRQFLMPVFKDQISIGGISFEKRKEHIKMSGSVISVSGYQIPGLKRIALEDLPVLCGIDNIHMPAVAVRVQLYVGIIDRKAEIGLKEHMEGFTLKVMVVLQKQVKTVLKIKVGDA